MEEYVNLECQKLCKAVFKSNFEEIVPLKASGSSRKYFRINVSGSYYIVCYSDNIMENRTFLVLSDYFLEKNINVPRILGVSNDFRLYILQDLGDRDLMSLIQSGNSPDRLNDIIPMVFSQLVRLQLLPQNEWNAKVEFPPLDSELIRYDFNYCFKNFFEVSDIELDKSKIQSEFNKLERRLLSYPEDLWGLMYRDFQSRNIMLHDGKPFFIDYQSCRRGPGIYDLVSFAWQAKARFSHSQRLQIIDLYCEELAENNVPDPERVKGQVCYWAMFRVIQTLGAYGLRGLKEGKQHFIESIPLAVKNLADIITGYDLVSEFPTLSETINRIAHVSHL